MTMSADTHSALSNQVAPHGMAMRMCPHMRSMGERAET
jgi:hypothetical protein